MINEYAVQTFPVILELKFQWRGGQHPDVSTLADCDIPRTVRWGETEYDFVAAILHRPGHWSVRVFHEDRLYVSQSEWLVPVEDTGSDAANVAWKMTPKNLGRSYPVRLYFARRERNNQTCQNNPEGKWFRCGDTPCESSLASDGAERGCPTSTSTHDVPPMDPLEPKHLSCQVPPPTTPLPSLNSPAKPVEHPVSTPKPYRTQKSMSPEIGNSGSFQGLTTPPPTAQQLPRSKKSGDKYSGLNLAEIPFESQSLPRHLGFQPINTGNSRPARKISSTQYVLGSPRTSNGGSERQALTSHNDALTNPDPVTTGARSAVSESPTPRGNGLMVDNQERIILPSQRRLQQPHSKNANGKRSPDTDSELVPYMEISQTPFKKSKLAGKSVRKSVRKSAGKSAGKRRQPKA